MFLFFLILLLGAAPLARAQSETGAVVVGDRVVFSLRTSVGSITPGERAGIVNRRLERILSEPALGPETLEVQETDDGPVIALPELPVVEVTAADARAEGVTPDVLAARWAQALRGTLLDAKPLHRAAKKGQPAHGVSFQPLLLVSALAFVVPLLALRLKRFRVPVVVGEILLGMLIGRSGFGLVSYSATLQFLAEFGFAFLMFLSGLEVDVSLLRPAPKSAGESAAGPKVRGAWKRSPLAIAGLTLALTLALAAGFALALMRLGLLSQPWMMALVLSTTSLGLIVPVLKERKETGTAHGQALLVTALAADFVTMFLITVVAGWVSNGLSFQLFLGLLILVAFAVAVRVGRVLHRLDGLRAVFEELGQATTQLPVRGSLALMLAFVALSEQLGTEVILGAFLAGVLLSVVTGKGSTHVHEKLEALGFGFFIPVFFIMVGARFDLSVLLGSPQGLILAPVLIAGAFAIKIIAALPFRAIVGWRATLASGFLISSRLSLIIAAAEIGQRLGLFSEAVYAALIAVALVSSIAGPLGFGALLPKPADGEEAQAGAVARRP